MIPEHIAIILDGLIKMKLIKDVSDGQIIKLAYEIFDKLEKYNLTTTILTIARSQDE